VALSAAGVVGDWCGTSTGLVFPVPFEPHRPGLWPQAPLLIQGGDHVNGNESFGLVLSELAASGSLSISG
jgi:hypothetical protein